MYTIKSWNEDLARRSIEDLLEQLRPNPDYPGVANRIRAAIETILALREAELLRRLWAAEADRIAHERAAHEADLRTQAAVRAEKAAQQRIAELEAALRNLVETDFAGGDAWVRAKLLLRKKP